MDTALGEAPTIAMDFGLKSASRLGIFSSVDQKQRRALPGNRFLSFFVYYGNLYFYSLMLF
jgi:hypothetical protein